MKRLIHSLHSPIARILIGLVTIAVAGYLLAKPQSAATVTGFTVNTTLDLPDINPGDGLCNTDVATCSLRAAITESNFVGGANVITVPAGTYTLTLGPADDEFNGAGATMESGDLDIVDLSLFSLPTLTSVTINGAGAGTTIINGGGIDRVIDVNNFAASGQAVNVTLNGLTITNGNAPNSSGYNEPGGGIQFDGFDNQTFLPGGTLTITNCNVTNNTAAGQAGGILAIFGSLNMSGSQVSGNTSSNAAGGGISYDGSAFSGLRTLQVTNSSISNNHANNGTFGRGGGIWAGGNANKTVTYSVITSNTAGAQGGGVYNGGGSLAMTYNVIVGNTASGAPTSSGFHNNAGAVTADNNWWGCNAGPGASPCDRASGAVTVASWLKLSHTATPNTIEVNQSTSLQADFFTNNLGTGIAASDLVALNGRAITFNNAVLGTISGADATINAGKANATFTAGATPGNGSADATVDQATATALILVTQAPMVATNPTDQTACDGTSVSFSASANGSPTPTVQWQVSTDGGANFTDLPGETSTTLTFTATASQNGNKYRAVFTNAGGSATTTAATLTVPADTATTDPADVTVCEGALVSFSTTASGGGPFHYAWTVDGNPYNGDSPSITVNTTGFSQGAHTVTVTTTGFCGSDSQTATLTINNVPPTITVQTPNIVMWPPNHNYHTFTLADFGVTAVSGCDGSNLTNSVVITSVSSDEPEDNLAGADGTTLLDILIAGDCKSLQLRTERDANLNGRVYTITFKVTDSHGQSATATATVSIPVNQSGAPAVNDGPAGGYTVTSACGP